MQLWKINKLLDLPPTRCSILSSIVLQNLIIMKVSVILSLLGVSFQVVAAARENHHRVAESKPSVFLLAGDSTTATQAANGGGWGDGFKNFTLKAPSFAINYGHNGATTSSFISGGDWATVLGKLEAYAGNSTVYVTIQFGHNDMKLTNYTETFKTNLRRMISDVKGRNGEPVIVTSLSRRNYNTNGTIADTLAPWAGYAIEVAEETETHYIDLWKNSVHYLEEIGQPASLKLALNSDDRTHLNVAGSIVFGRMVSDLLKWEISAIAAVVKENATLSEQIWSGVATY
ncbi:SGNH hydrolase-type esterase domain-containing protein [Morchella snyderi]|nr:SGNH hydrolase-type esterase domain-containing protein [Morchella snyderi]